MFFPFKKSILAVLALIPGSSSPFKPLRVMTIFTRIIPYITVYFIFYFSLWRSVGLQGLPIMYIELHHTYDSFMTEIFGHLGGAVASRIPWHWVQAHHQGIVRWRSGSSFTIEYFQHFDWTQTNQTF